MMELGIGGELFLMGLIITFSALLGIIALILAMLKLSRKLSRPKLMEAASMVKLCPRCLSMIPKDAANCPWCRASLSQPSRSG